ncbi:MAG: tyrosine--tRNA ligase, partial [Dehalococcoidia bacterium]
MLLKKRLARELVAEFHDARAAADAEAGFERVIQRREVPEDISVEVSEQEMPASITQLLARKGLVKSRSEARRLLAQLAIEVVHADGSKLINDDDMKPLRAGDVVRVGKHRFLKVV